MSCISRSRTDMRRLLIALTSFVLLAAPAFAAQAPAGAERLRPGRYAAAVGAVAGGAAADRRLRVRLARGDGVPVFDLAAPEQGRGGHALALEQDTAMTAGHFIFIPSVALVGMVIGWGARFPRRSRCLRCGTASAGGAGG